MYQQGAEGSARQEDQGREVTVYKGAGRLTSELLANGAFRTEHRCACAGSLLSNGLLDRVSTCTFGELRPHAGVAEK